MIGHGWAQRILVMRARRAISACEKVKDFIGREGFQFGSEVTYSANLFGTTGNNSDGLGLLRPPY